MKLFLLIAVVSLVEAELKWCQECSVLESCPNNTKNTACIVDFCSTLDEGNYYANATDALDGLGRAVAANATEDSLNAKFKNFKSKLDELPAFYAKPPVGKQVDLNKTFDIGMGFGGGITGVDFLVDQLYVNDALYAKFRQEVETFEMIFLLKMEHKNFKPFFEKLEKAYRNLPQF
ncbi:hypothetical protein AAVH_34092 [Aphelenchoides avenae]|nr:hypothetical protein AAVH_34092 [Aphelenchus avenae]